MNNINYLFYLLKYWYLIVMRLIGVAKIRFRRRPKEEKFWKRAIRKNFEKNLNAESAQISPFQLRRQNFGLIERRRRSELKKKLKKRPWVLGIIRLWVLSLQLNNFLFVSFQCRIPNIDCLYDVVCRPSAWRWYCLKYFFIFYHLIIKI